MPTKATSLADIHHLAHEAGLEAGKAAIPTPMVVQTHRNMADDNSPVVRNDFVSGGVCGFAWVVVENGRSKFAKYLRDEHDAHKDYYYGGRSWWVRDFGQSMERKIAYASAYASVLQANGIEAFVQSRMD